MQGHPAGWEEAGATQQIPQSFLVTATAGLVASAISAAGKWNGGRSARLPGQTGFSHLRCVLCDPRTCVLVEGYDRLLGNTPSCLLWDEGPLGCLALRQEGSQWQENLLLHKSVPSTTPFEDPGGASRAAKAFRVTANPGGMTQLCSHRAHDTIKKAKATPRMGERGANNTPDKGLGSRI